MRLLGLMIALLAACGGSETATLASVGTSPSAGGVDAGVPAVDGGAPDPAGDAGAPEPPVAPPQATLAGCPVFGPQSDWNRDVSADPVDDHSTQYMEHMDTALRLQPDFGRAPYGMPINVVPAAQPKAPITFRYATQSDPGPYPIPQDVRLQSNDDRHAIVVDRDACMLYETYFTFSDGQGGFRADSGAVWNLSSPALRPDDFTSATASGLPLAAGLVRYDEATSGEIRHALAFIAGTTAHAFVHPATHATGTSNAQFAPPMGLRVRLRADFDLTPYHGAARTILVAMQRYGMLLIDNASGLPFWSVMGEQDERWDTADLDQLKSVPTAAFEVVRLGELHPGL